jgi:hypothetical protein
MPSRKPNERRTMYGRFKGLYKWSLGKVYKPTVRSPREEVTAELRRNFGNTFAEGAHFYVSPDWERFVACILHAATGGRVPLDAEVGAIFVKNTSAKGSIWYTVDGDSIERLGCSKKNLADFMSRLPAATGSSSGAVLLDHVGSDVSPQTASLPENISGALSGLSSDVMMTLASRSIGSILDSFIVQALATGEPDVQKIRRVLELVQKLRAECLMLSPVAHERR